MVTSLSVDRRVRLAGWIALITSFLTVGLITFGAWVRASGAGLGCPDWPLCHGAVVPQLEGDVAIEYGHRFYGGVVMLMVMAGVWASYGARRTAPVVFRLLVVTLGVVLLQAVLGGITVLTELHGAVRFMHLITAMLTLGLLTAAALWGLGVRPGLLPGLRFASGLLAINVFVMLVGGLIVWSGAGPGCPGLPFCDERSTAMVAWLHNLHRAGALLLLMALLVNAVWVRGYRGERLAIGVRHGAAFLAASQIVIGVAAVTQTLPEGLRVLHVGVATLIWWFVVTQWLLALKARLG